MKIFGGDIAEISRDDIKVNEGRAAVCSSLAHLLDKKGGVAFMSLICEAQFLAWKNDRI